MNNFQFTIDGQIVDLDTFVPEERHFSPNDPAYALMDLYSNMGSQGSSQPSHAGSHRSSQSGYETSSSKATSKHSSRGGYETGGSVASGHPSSRTPTVASHRTPGAAGYLEAPPSQASHHSSRSYGSEHITTRREPSVHSLASSRHTEMGSPSVHSHASSRHTDMSSRTPTVASSRTAGAAGYLEAPPSHASHHSSRSYGSEHSTIRGEPSTHSHASSRHTEMASPSIRSHASSHHTEAHTPSRISHAASRRTEVYSPSHISRSNTHHSSSHASAAPSIKRSSTGTLSGYDTVGPEDSISSAGSKPERSSASRR
ncbi:hypothetical protein DFP73DRAFT_561877 [Morchella snyderi]|nr:hypothetical protein DFP73DRAFT_561877 [Morchella snyderi]